MPQSTITKIKEMLNQNESLNSNGRDHILGLLAELEVEVASMPDNKVAEAKAVIELTHQKLESICAQSENEIPYGDLEDAALEFEVEHPKFTYIVQSICQSLSSLGI
jgi:hypothetical protein